MSHPIYSDPEWMQKFLHNAAKYFENRPTDGEDKAYWANTYNAEKCRKIADEIEKLRTALRQIRDQEPDRQAWSVGVARKALGEKEQTND
jgi:hypothetical protein